MFTESVKALLRPSKEVQRIEQHACEYLDHCIAAKALSDVPLPVPVDTWIENPLMIKFGIADLSYLGDDVLGATFIEEREILVSESTLSNEARFRFTCAHELGHMALHTNSRPVFHETSETGLRSNDRLECQANRFAGAFLMPVPLLIEQLIKICDQHRLDWKRATALLSQETSDALSLWKKRILPGITTRFGVSLSTAVFRFGEIEIDGDPFLPRALVAPLLRPTPNKTPPTEETLF